MFNQASLPRLGHLFAGYPATLDPQTCNFLLGCDSPGLFVPIPGAVEKGRCSIFGTWDGVSAVDGTNPESRASYAFLADGTWVGGRHGADPVATRFMRGVYRASETSFEILSSEGMGCPCSFGAGFVASFDGTCATLKFGHRYDNCTGGRRYLMPGGSTLVRRP